jgi:hypothetical protein
MIHVVAMQRLGSESSPEVSSSSPITSISTGGLRLAASPNPPGSSSSELGEVDLDFWDLDLSSRRGMITNNHMHGSSSSQLCVLFASQSSVHVTRDLNSMAKNSFLRGWRFLSVFSWFIISMVVWRNFSLTGRQ